jgi:hypothetical protein
MFRGESRFIMREREWASASVYMRSSLFLDVTQLSWSSADDVLGKPVDPMSKDQGGQFKDCSAVGIMRPIGCPETSVITLLNTS